MLSFGSAAIATNLWLEGGWNKIFGHDDYYVVLKLCAALGRVTHIDFCTWTVCENPLSWREDWFVPPSAVHDDPGWVVLLCPVEDGVSWRAHLPVCPGDDVHPRSGGTGRFSCSSDWPRGAEVCAREVRFALLSTEFDFTVLCCLSGNSYLAILLNKTRNPFRPGTLVAFFPPSKALTQHFFNNTRTQKTSKQYVTKSKSRGLLFTVSLAVGSNALVVSCTSEVMMPVRLPSLSVQQQPTLEPARHWAPCCPKEPWILQISQSCSRCSAVWTRLLWSWWGQSSINLHTSKPCLLTMPWTGIFDLSLDQSARLSGLVHAVAV